VHCPRVARRGESPCQRACYPDRTGSPLRLRNGSAAPTIGPGPAHPGVHRPQQGGEPHVIRGE
jgi:hypothetical protein